MGANFEVVSKYSADAVTMPVRKTAQSAGYDLCAVEDVILPPMANLTFRMKNAFETDLNIVSLGEMNEKTKQLKARPTLVSTGVKCKLDPGTYLELSVRSSSPLKYWIVMANGVGIIDADYYNNPDNEGEIFLQLLNLSPYSISIPKGTALAQGIIKPYLTTESDSSTGVRKGGFGSTTV